ncbi:AraC family transcriptional regulator [Leifsonia sp. AG29]|uniref:AraC family transcriptional regulator n=1 Tax=Leifsonia sp. AG29 TaxID=2598860 RepID=UPI00131A649A|nr:AraC family transcriptional regulator [Leifsonia sp. AG29]
MDVLSDVLERARARGAVFSVLRRVEPWGLLFGGSRVLTAHILLDGRAWLEREGEQPVELEQHAVLLMTSGTEYAIVSEPGARREAIRDARVAGTVAETGPSATVLCGAYTLEGSVAAAVLADLPRPVVIPPSWQEPTHRLAIQLLAEEAARETPGQQALLDRLLDTNLVYALRAWWLHSAGTAPGWFTALGDPDLRRVLEAIHARPADPWTLPELARVARMSRSGFAGRFSRQVGVPPATYLTTVRMERAEEALRHTDATLGEIATAVGYSNPFAFATAFRRHHGLAPGRWRQRARGEDVAEVVSPGASGG